MFIEDKKSRVYLLKNCPLDTTYEHTIQFDNREQQAEYFSSLAKYQEVEMSYVRHTENKVYVELLADNIYDCNYIMFQNSNFGNKWFYYFVTNVEYVNNNTSMLTLSCDVMQTWYFDYELGQCFVEREHSKTDKIGDNIVDENLDCGDYVVDGVKWADFEERVNVLAIANANGGDGEVVKVYGGLYSGCYYQVFENTEKGATQLSREINRLVEDNKKDEIVAIFTMPKKFVQRLKPQGINTYPENYEETVSKNYNKLDGYTPRNNKLYIYPYNFLMVSNNLGEQIELRYEFFNSTYCHFEIAGSMCVAPEIKCIPKHYKGRNRAFDDSSTINGYPQLSYSTDTFTAWYAQNIGTGKFAFDAIGGALSTFKGTGSGMAAADTAMLSVFNTASEGLQYSTKGQQNHGNNNGSLITSMNALRFTFLQKTITYEYAKTIDNFFTMYGYATKKLKKPNIKVRKNFTYTKVKTCVIKGSVPANDLKAISSIYKKGITFWVWPSKIGDYSVDNSPL